jgi:hypothetical protein
MTFLPFHALKAAAASLPTYNTYNIDNTDNIYNIGTSTTFQHLQRAGEGRRPAKKRRPV